MQKIRHNVWDSMIERCSSKELDFLLYVSQFQNDIGQVQGLNWKKVCLEVNIPKSTFYSVLSSLEKKNIIHINYWNQKDWDIVILNNVILSSNYSNFVNNGYVRTHFKFLRSSEFRNLSLYSKRAVLKILKSLREDNYFKIAKDTILKNTKGANVDDIVSFFHKNLALQISNEILYIKILKPKTKSYKETDFFKILQSKLETFSKKYKISYTLQDLEDLYYILVNHKNEKFRNHLIGKMIDTSLIYKSLQPAMINIKRA